MNVPGEKTKKLDAKQVQCMYIGPGEMLEPKRKGAVFINIDDLREREREREKFIDLSNQWAYQ